jgi:hypothetical protein
MNTRGNREVHSEVVGRHAVVLGGSLAGLLAARVLTDHFERVTLIERDAYPETPEVRKGIPQANHVHGLLLRGRQVLEELFPGLQDEMIAAGAPLLDMANDIAWFTRAGWGIRFPSELKVLAWARSRCASVCASVTVFVDCRDAFSGGSRRSTKRRG